jgi:hypothetical protein
MAPPTFNPWPLLDSKLSLAVQLHSLPIFMAGNIAWGDCHLLHDRFPDRITAGLACGSKNLHWTVEIHFTFGHDRIIDSIGHQELSFFKTKANFI